MSKNPTQNIEKKRNKTGKETVTKSHQQFPTYSQGYNVSYGSTVVKKNKLTVNTNTAVSFDSIQYKTHIKKTPKVYPPI